MQKHISGFVAVLCLLLSSGCTTLHYVPEVSVVPTVDFHSHEEKYGQLYPASFEFCAFSRLKPLQGARGGIGGHVAMYLEGVCSKKDSAYPALEMCPAPSGAQTQRGTGISVDKMFKNVNWVAITDKDLFFGTDLLPGEVLTPERVHTAIRKALAQGWFRSVRFHEKWMRDKPEAMSDEEYVAQKTLGTDYAIAYGRYGECVKVPVTPAMLERMIKFLNGLNEKFFSGENYEWSGLHDNCAHPLHNALASADILEPKKVNAGLIRQFFNLAVPANEFSDLAALVTEDFPDDPDRILNDPRLRKTLEEYDWLPMRQGVLVRKIGPYAENQCYDRHSELLMMAWPWVSLESRKSCRLFGDSRFTDIQKNLRYFKESYAAILEKFSAREESDSSDPRFVRYRTYVRRQLKDVEEKLNYVS